MQPTESLSITLPAEMARMIRAKVDAGTYGSNSEVICEALQDWMEREHRLLALDQAITQGVTDSDSGRVQEIKTVREELHNYFALNHMVRILQE